MRRPLLALTAALTAATGLLLACDRVAVATAAVHFNTHRPTPIRETMLAACILLAVGFSIVCLRSGRPLRLLVLVSLAAGAASNLLCFPVFGGVPDFIPLFSLAHGTRLYASVGDLAIFAGQLGLVTVVLPGFIRRPRVELA